MILNIRNNSESYCKVDRHRHREAPHRGTYHCEQSDLNNLKYSHRERSEAISFDKNKIASPPARNDRRSIWSLLFASPDTSRDCKTRKHKKQKGLTLIEMILIMVIVAIGASLAIPNFRHSMEQRKENMVKESMRTIAYCVREYVRDYSVFPSSITKLSDDENAGVPLGSKCLKKRLLFENHEIKSDWEYTYSILSGVEDGQVFVNKDEDNEIVLKLCAGTASSPQREVFAESCT